MKNIPSEIVHFSKTEKLPNGNWLVTIAPADHVKVDGKHLSRPRKFEQLQDTSGFKGVIIEKTFNKFPHQLTIFCLSKFPCVGMENILCGKPIAEAGSGLPTTNMISDWLDKNGDPEIEKQVHEEAKLLNQEHMSKTTNLTFGEALEALKSGLKVARQGWNGKNMFLFLLPAGTVPTQAIHDPALRAVIEKEVGGNTFEALGSIRMFTADKKILTGWLASQTDMLSEDWNIVE